MPRHENTPLFADARLNRHHPDLLPTHRQCIRCNKVKRLDTDSFYESHQRYPWNLSRFGRECIPCAIAFRLSQQEANKPSRNAKARQRRADIKANPAQVRTRTPRLTPEAEAQRNKNALIKRIVRRKRGPYSEATDPIKMYIRAQTEERRMRKVLRKSMEPVDAPLSQLPLSQEQRDYVQSLRDLRDRGVTVAPVVAASSPIKARAAGWLPFGPNQTRSG